MLTVHNIPALHSNTVFNVPLWYQKDGGVDSNRNTFARKKQQAGLEVIEIKVCSFLWRRILCQSEKQSHQ